MGIYVTSSGFAKRTVQQILNSFNSSMQTLFGPAVDISPEGPTGQLLGIPAAGLGDVWNGVQEAYVSMDVDQASGAALDRLCAYTGVVRIAAAESNVKALLYTDSSNIGVTIPAGSQARRVRGAVVFSLSTNTVIAPGSCQDIYLSLAAAPASGASVTLITTFGTFTVTTPTLSSPAARTLQTLLLLAGAAQASAWGTPTDPAVTPGVAQVWTGGSLVTPLVDTLGGCQVATGTFLRLANISTAFGVTLTAAWNLLAAGSQGSFICNLVGNQVVNPNELTSIVTPQTGWNSITNLALGIPGRDVETDTALRIRRKQQLGVGLATEAAMQAYVLNNVPGVTSVTVTSNRTDSVDIYSADPHSITATVVGGTVAAIAQAIWDSMPAGIATSGNTAGTATDSQGTTHAVKFNIPVSVPIWVKVLYDLYSEEQFPSDGQAEMAAALVDWCDAEFSPGRDVIAPRLLAPAYTVPGIGNMQITVSTDGVTYVAGPIAMTPGQIATVSSAHISFGTL
jgi:uncharacterized phage protein gp47/JayE